MGQNKVQENEEPVLAESTMELPLLPLPVQEFRTKLSDVLSALESEEKTDWDQLNGLDVGQLKALISKTPPKFVPRAGALLATTGWDAFVLCAIAAVGLFTDYCSNNTDKFIFLQFAIAVIMFVTQLDHLYHHQAIDSVCCVGFSLMQVILILTMSGSEQDMQLPMELEVFYVVLLFLMVVLEVSLGTTAICFFYFAFIVKTANQPVSMLGLGLVAILIYTKKDFLMSVVTNGEYAWVKRSLYWGITAATAIISCYFYYSVLVRKESGRASPPSFTKSR